MITGFQANLAVDDGGTGGTGASTKFAGLVMLELGELAVGKFDATELNQTLSGGAADPYEREEPTGLIKVGETNAEIKYTKANLLRIQNLLGDRGKTFVITAPDDQTTPGTPVVLTCTFKGFVSKLGKVKFEKKTPVSIPFELTVSEAPAYA